jgi:peptide/nickel transport system permease protein
VVRRLAALIALSIGITFIAFALTQLVPGDPIRANLGQIAQTQPEVVKAFRHHYGLDKPLPVQYLRYLGNLLHGDLGESEQTHDSVRHDLSQFAPATAELALTAMLFAVVVGVGLGILAAVRRNRPTDHALRLVSLGGISVPTFWLALLALYVFFFRLGWFPGGGRLDPGVLTPPHVTGLYTVDALIAGQWATLWDAIRHLILPALVLALFNVGLLTRYTRSAVLEVIDEEYVQGARAKGLPERTVVSRYILRAALPSIVTVTGVVFASILAGAVLVENIFAWPGVGQYAYKSAVSLDLPAIMGVSIFIALVYVLVNLVVDLLLAAIDPRVRLA